MNTETQEYIVGQIKADDWEDVEDTFGGLTPSEIEAALDGMFPSEDNETLARMIFDNVA